MALELTDDNFQQVVADNELVIVDFWADWCGPCRLVSSVMDRLSDKYEGKVTISKMDVDSNSNIPAQFGIRNIPTVLIFKNGHVMDRLVGARIDADYSAAIDRNM